MLSIFKKEIHSFFSSIVGYLAMLIFIIACGLFLWVVPSSSILDYGYASMDRFFELAPWFLLLLIPSVTMRAFAEEFRTGTIEWLSTKPISSTNIVLGKYFASVVLVAAALLPTLIYVYSISNLSAIEDSIDYGSIIGSYFGLLFLVAGFNAVGIFCSTLASNQIVGFLIALFSCYILFYGFESLSAITELPVGFDYYLSMIGMSYHYNSISRGIIDSRDVLYFLSIIIFFLSLSTYSLTKRTWDKAQ
jgi:ABC-2 type transport system permease protein